MAHTKLDITAGAYLSAAIGVLLLPLKWLLCAFLAASFHELGHLIALWICNVPVHSIRIGMFGAGISTGSLTEAQELICAISGPVFSLSLLAFAGYLPVLSLLGLIQGLFNLIPILPMDGGRVARSGYRLLTGIHRKEISLEK